MYIRGWFQISWAGYWDRCKSLCPACFSLIHQIWIIYGTPNEAAHVLKYDSFTGITSRLPENERFLSSSNKHQLSNDVASWWNGNVHFMSYLHYKGVKFNPFTQFFELFRIGDILEPDWKWWGWVEADDENIYAIRNSRSRVLKIDVGSGTRE